MKKGDINSPAMKFSLFPPAALAVALLPSPLFAGTVTWYPTFKVASATDIRNPVEASLRSATDFGTAAGPQDKTVNGVLFTFGTGNVAGEFSSNMTDGPSAGGGTYFTGSTNDPDLTAMLDSHSYVGGDPGTAAVTLIDLSPGRAYLVQLVGVADDRDCCAGRVYETDDGTGNFGTGKTMQRGLHQSVIGTFKADASGTQIIQIRSQELLAGNSDPGLSGLVLFDYPDTDGDGLPDEWESQYGLNPSLADSNSNGTPDNLEDGDNDGLKNGAEFAVGTDPTVADTDGDGLKDGVETRTGVYISATDTGTNPVMEDTDRDGLPDGAENPLAANGSDPHLPDTDGDLFPDGMEVAAGSSPNNPASTPHNSIIERLGTGTGALLGGDATDRENNIDDTAGGEGLNFNWASVTSLTNAPLTFSAEGALNIFDNRVGGSTDKWCCAAPPQDITVELVGGLALSHFTIASSNDTPGRDPAAFAISGSNDDVTYTPLFSYSGPTGPWTDRLQVVKFTLGTPAALYQYIRYEVTADSGAGAHSISEIEYFGSSPDGDGDGMPDSFEDENGLNKNSSADRDTDKDGDGLSNYEEYVLGTSPQKKDTDGDGLWDSVETKTGSWSNVSDTGTDPLKADTDGDSLPDGVENPDLPFTGPSQTGSDPNKVDTDGDFFDDSAEVAAGKNPNDAASFPGGVGIELLGTGTGALLGGDLTDPENDIDDSGGGSGLNYNWVSARVFGTDSIFDAEGPLGIFDNRVGGGTDKWCCDAPPQEMTVEFANPVSLTHFTVSSSNDTPARDPVTWGIYGSNDDVSFTAIAEIDGPVALWTERLQVLKFTLAAPTPLYKYIKYGVTATGSNIQHALGEIEYFGTGGGGGPASPSFHITDIRRDPATGNITLTWESIPGKTYSIQYSTKLSSFPGDLGVNLPAAGAPAATSSHTFPNPGANEPKMFFRVLQLP